VSNGGPAMRQYAPSCATNGAAPLCATISPGDAPLGATIIMRHCQTICKTTSNIPGDAPLSLCATVPISPGDAPLCATIIMRHSLSLSPGDAPLFPDSSFFPTHMFAHTFVRVHVCMCAYVHVCIVMCVQMCVCVCSCRRGWTSSTTSAPTPRR
jgi:hypothetical protein